MGAAMRLRSCRRLLRYDWPLHFVLLLTNWLPDNVVFLRLRGFAARFFLGTCGCDLRLGRNVTFYNPSKVHIGSHVYIALGCWFMAGETITVDDEVMFGPYCVIASSTHTRVDRSFRYGPADTAPIRVGRGAWIAGHVTVTAGTAIGEGTLVAAGAVVTGDIPADVVAAGVPARVVKNLAD
jgi:acetyltransferase-like isoleucine patch superfamily enzyme